MIHRVTRTYLAAAIFILAFLGTVQLLRYSGRSVENTASKSSTSWKEWMWPTYSGETQAGDVINSTPPELSRPSDHVSPVSGDHDSYSEETAVSSNMVPITVTVTHTEKAEPTPVPVPVNCPSSNARAMAPLQAVNTTFSIPKDMVHSAAGPKPSEIVMVTASDGKGHNGGIEDILGKTAQNRKAYCQHHGYNYHFVNISKYDMGDAHPVWKKIPAIVEAFNTFPHAKWLFFLDLDAIIMSPKQDLTELVLSHEGMKKSMDFGRQWTAAERAPLGVFQPQHKDTDYDNIDMLVAQDQNGVNAGSFFLRRSMYTQWMLNMWSDPFFMKMDWPGQEQDTLQHFIKHHRIFREHTGLIKQRVANAYVEGGPTMQWYKGDLVVHLAGCWVNHKCAERWNNFWDKRETI